LGAYGVILLLACSVSRAADGKRAFFEGYSLLQKGYMEKAIPFFEQAVKDAPEHSPTYSKLAECYETLGQYDKAIPLWKTYVELRPQRKEQIAGHLDLLQNMVDAEAILARKDASEKDTEKAQALLLEVSRDKYRGSCIAEKAILLLLPHLIEQEAFEESLRLSRRIVQEFPDALTPQVHLYWGMSLRGMSEFLDAIAVLEKAEKLFERDPLKQKECRRQTALAHLGVADELIARGQHLPAREALKLVRGRFLSTLSPEEILKVQKMLTACEAAQVLEWIAQGDKYAEQGMYEDAIRWYAKVRTLTFSNSHTLLAEERIRAVERIADEQMARIEELVNAKRYADAMALAEKIENAFPARKRIPAMRRYADVAVLAWSSRIAKH
jgi:tetratricopeptide (TPR) repeat protein